MLQIRETALPGVVVLTPRRFADARGFFVETWNARRMAEHGFDIAFVQDNLSLSLPKGTLRGLHYQAPPHAQGKLVSCVRGAIRDIAVDVRRGSPTWGHWVAEDLSFANGAQLWIPPGFLHGFLTLEPETVVSYKCTDFYDPAAEGSVHWDSCGIDWAGGAGGLETPPLLSDKDAVAPRFADWVSPFDI